LVLNPSCAHWQVRRSYRIDTTQVVTSTWTTLCETRAASAATVSFNSTSAGPEPASRVVRILSSGAGGAGAELAASAAALLDQAQKTLQDRGRRIT